MTTPFPNLASRQDSSKYSVSKEDVAARSEMEGGYTYTRRKHTRRPRLTFKTGYTHLTNAEKKQLQDHWDAVGGGSVIFQWKNDQDGLTYQVRYKMETQDFTYAGLGEVQRWNCNLIFEQA